MKLKQLAVRGLVTLGVITALCLYFSGTLRTMTTAKVKQAPVRTGKLETQWTLTGKLAFLQTERVSFALPEGQSLVIRRVDTRVGYQVKAGDVLIEASLADYETNLSAQEAAYGEASEALALLESKNSGLRLRKTDETYAEKYFLSVEAGKAALSAKVAMDAQLLMEGLTLPESGNPEGASEALLNRIAAWRTAAADEAAARQALSDVARLKPDEAVWTYLTERRSLEQKMDEAEGKMRTLSALQARAAQLCAPHDGYVAELSVREGDTWDGGAPLYSLTAEGELPALRAEVQEVTVPIQNGAEVQIEADGRRIALQVSGTGYDSDGKKVADVPLTDEAIRAFGSVYALSQAEAPMTLISRAATATTLLPAAAVRTSGKEKYVLVIDEVDQGLGGKQMRVSKVPVTVLGESQGVVSVQEDLSWYDIAYMEDREIDDGDTVMAYS